MTATVSNAVAQRTNAATQVVEQYRNIFAETLPSHVKPETFVRVAQGALRKNADLAAAAASNPQSLVAALLDAARLGLEPGTEQFYLVPMGGEVNGWTGYQGEIELIFRAGAVSSVIAEVVYTNDRFHYQPGMDRPDHEVDWDADDRGQLRLVYAYASMKDGSTSRVVVMNKATVMKHKAMSRGSDRADSPWQKWSDSMWLKTAVHELTKWVPTSAEYLRDQARAAGEMVRHATRPTSAPPSPSPPVHAPREEARPEPIRADVFQGEVIHEPAGTAEDPFPAERSATARIATPRQVKAIHASMGGCGVTEEVGKHAWATELLGFEVKSFSDLTSRQASTLIDAVNRESKNGPKS